MLSYLIPGYLKIRDLYREAISRHAADKARIEALVEENARLKEEVAESRQEARDAHAAHIRDMQKFADYQAVLFSQRAIFGAQPTLPPAPDSLPDTSVPTRRGLQKDLERQFWTRKMDEAKQAAAAAGDIGVSKEATQ